MSGFLFDTHPSEMVNEILIMNNIISIIHYQDAINELNELCEEAERRNWWENNHWDDPPDHIADPWGGWCDDSNYAKYMLEALNE